MLNKNGPRSGRVGSVLEIRSPRHLVTLPGYEFIDGLTGNQASAANFQTFQGTICNESVGNSAADPQKMCRHLDGNQPRTLVIDNVFFSHGYIEA